MHASELWEGRGFGPVLARCALAPFSFLYGIGWEAYLGIYRLGLKKAAHPHSPILCVGNLVSGGSGKTPVVLHLIGLLREMGYTVVVSSSGYGSPKSEAANLPPEGELNPEKWGDEAALFRHKYPDLNLIVGRRRVLAAEYCHEVAPDSILLMDDGFQHLPLKKDLTILLDPEKPKNRMCLPAGPYREPRWNRKRADLVIPGQFRIEESTQITNIEGDALPPPPECSLLCAIGQPQNVIAALEALGSRIVRKFLLPDHNPLTGGTLIQNLPSHIPTVVTAKDWVKLRNRADVGEREFLILDHQVQIEPKAEFTAWLKSHLDGIQKANHPR
jgi:tetraacyldisaccharide 4'-kinase